MARIVVPFGSDHHGAARIEEAYPINIPSGHHRDWFIPFFIDTCS
jgi:hypothetical protein